MMVPEAGFEPALNFVLSKGPTAIGLLGQNGVTGETRTPKATRSERALYANSR